MLYSAGAGIMGKPPELGLNLADGTLRPPLTERPSRASEPLFLPSHLRIHLQTGSGLGQSPGTHLQQTYRVCYLQASGWRGLCHSTQHHCLHHHDKKKPSPTSCALNSSAPSLVLGSWEAAGTLLRPGTPLAWARQKHFLLSAIHRRKEICCEQTTLEHALSTSCIGFNSTAARRGRS